MGLFDQTVGKAWIDFACPECGFTNACQVNQVQSGCRVHCRGCHLTIQLVDNDASTTTAKRKFDSAIGRFKRALRGR